VSFQARRSFFWIKSSELNCILVIDNEWRLGWSALKDLELLFRKDGKAAAEEEAAEVQVGNDIPNIEAVHAI